MAEDVVQGRARSATVLKKKPTAAQAAMRKRMAEQKGNITNKAPGRIVHAPSSRPSSQKGAHGRGTPPQRTIHPVASIAVKPSAYEKMGTHVGSGKGKRALGRVERARGVSQSEAYAFIKARLAEGKSVAGYKNPGGTMYIPARNRKGKLKDRGVT